jgi:hypothetical protein
MWIRPWCKLGATGWSVLPGLDDAQQYLIGLGAIERVGAIVRHKLVMLILLLLVTPVLCGLDGMSDGSWQGGTPVDFDDELLMGCFRRAHILTLQGPIVSSLVAVFTLLSNLPFHPPV